MGNRDARYRTLLSKQLEMNKVTWARLVAIGRPLTALRLDFAFRAPNEAAARSLVALISEQTDYEVAAESESSRLFRRHWSVIGRTQTTGLSLEILNQWVDWMVTAGLQSDDCEFDGWGTEA